jgi:pimeloyl-ACP methyl ester carboxylesterase
MWPDRAAPAGDGRTVVLINGFGMPPATLKPLGRWLRAGGWAVQTAPTGWNVGCGEATVERVCSLVDAVQLDGPVALVGHSRGGVLARVASVRLADRVSDLVTVCTPWTIGPPDRPGVAVTTGAVRFLRRHGVDTMGSVDCADGDCCTQFRAEMTAKPPAAWTAIWSSRDGIGGRDAMPPAAADDAVDIATTHLGSIASVPAWTAIAAALTRES